MHSGKKRLTILHTSDWHLGRSLYGRRRFEEFEAFLAWLADTVERESVDVLLVAGDVFDSGTPGNRSQELYYRFLSRVALARCGHVVVIAGNHDSPSFLNAPGELLKALHVHVVGASAGNAAEEVLVLRSADGSPELIVCAVPYLRERDIRTVESGESMDEKERKTSEGIRLHYAEVIALAERKRSELGREIPVIAMGHLFVSGGRIVEDGDARDLSVGSLAHIRADIFPDSLDYVALGHLHVPQKIKGLETMRYSGSPIPMGFGEGMQEKSVCLVTFFGAAGQVRLVPVPMFQALWRVRGELGQILSRIRTLALSGSRAWLEVLYEGEEVVSDLREQLDTAVNGTGMEILRVSNKRLAEQILGQQRVGESLADLNVNDVFERCLCAHEVPAEQRPGLLRAYEETLASLWEEDKGAFA